MKYVADLHVHSHFSRATSKAADLEGYSWWARARGIQVLGTGDFTHPGWFEEIGKKLVPAEPGLFRLAQSPPPPAELEELPLPDTPVRFCLSAEISSIYKKGDRTRKIHSLLFAPDMETAARISARLDMLGNIRSDGRPILGLDPKLLLELLLDISEDAHLIPAHIWTPWFSVLGSRSGFDSMEECFEELIPHIFAVETGLSSDPAMAWRCSFLDRYALVSHSDAHSPVKVGREADLLDAELSYPGLFGALKSRRGFLGTLEFHPEEGKYHWDGHRKCGMCLEPEQTVRIGGICPACGRKLTIGVMHRVLELADRDTGVRPVGAAGYRTLIPLAEILSEIHGRGPRTRTVLKPYRKLLGELGTEFSVLLEAPPEELDKVGGPLLAEAIRRMRAGETHPRPGFDGQFGAIRVFGDGELESLRGQGTLFRISPAAAPPRSDVRPRLSGEVEPRAASLRLDPEQEEAAGFRRGAVSVSAGPGSGKTRTLIRWICRTVKEDAARADRILAVTFTNRAADQMRSRLGKILGTPGRAVKIATFHSLCYELLQEWLAPPPEVYDAAARLSLLRIIRPGDGEERLRRISRRLERIMEGTDPQPEDQLGKILSDYRSLLDRAGCVDVSELVSRVNGLLESEAAHRRSLSRRYRHVAVDEFQDINPAQYRFLSHLLCPAEPAAPLPAGSPPSTFIIGDPHQAIYGFRGSDPGLFPRFAGETGAVRISLRTNYRSRAAIVRAANALIGDDRLKAVRDGGTIETAILDGAYEEARFIAEGIEELIGGSSHIAIDALHRREPGSYAYSDIGVLCRTRAVRDAAAKGLIGRGIPCSAVGHVSFALSPGIGEAISLLRLAANHHDLASLASVLRSRAGFDDARLHDLLRRGEPEQALEQAGDLLRLLTDLNETVKSRGIPAALGKIFAPREGGEDRLQREMLLETARTYDRDLGGFLRRISLSPFESEGEGKAEAVRLLTFHAAKGLEFPAVFIAGAEEGVTPVGGRDADMAEERRLFYVAMTRAMDRLTITCCRSRLRFGLPRPAQPSRFIEEIPEELRSVRRVRSGRPRQLELF